MRVLVADAHPEVRWALRAVIGEEPGLAIVGEVSDSEHLVQIARSLRPDLILLEWELPGWPREELLAALSSLNDGSRLIVLSRQPEAKQAALAAGADAFFSKANGPEPLLVALRSLVHEEESRRWLP